jgi:preprotein translocase subunit SecD
MEVTMILLRETLMAASLFVCCVATDPANQDDKKSPIKFELRRAESKPAAGLTEAVVAGTKEKVYLHKEAAITNKEIAEAHAATDDSNNPAIAITFTKEGRKKFAELTRQHQGKPLAILVDGKVLCAPTVRDEVSGDKAMISGSFTKEETEKIANGIKAK